MKRHINVNLLKRKIIHVTVPYYDIFVNALLQRYNLPISKVSYDIFVRHMAHLQEYKIRN